MDNLLSYYGLVDARISTSEKDLPVKNTFFCFVEKNTFFEKLVSQIKFCSSACVIYEWYLIMNSPDMVKEIVAGREPFATGCTIMLANV